jgi:predicted GNAT family acetyltransferase
MAFGQIIFLFNKAIMNFLHKENKQTGMFYLEGEKDKETTAEIVYSIELPDRIIIQHTSVSNELRGKNVGYELVKAVVELARGKDLKVVPVCSFASSVFQRKKEFADVLA